MPKTQRINQLENAHRMLHARVEGLFMACFVMLPLINETQAVKCRLLTSAVDLLNDHMASSGYDEAFQANARASIDALTDVILLPQVAA